MSLDIFYRL